LSDEEALHVLQEAWDLLDAEFYGELPSPEERVYAAIRGMLDTLDDEYTSFSEPSIAAIRRADASGEFEGIGALVTMNDDSILEIVETFSDSPAEDAGLRQGDLVLAVDGESIVGFGIFDAITLIRGPEGTEVELSIKRGDADPFQVRIVRARLDIPIIESRMLDDGIGYVRLFDFSRMATTRLEEALEELFDQGAAALILDLRGNPGGFLDQAVQVADVFLDEGLILVERRSDGQQEEFTSTNEGIAQDVPLVVLVNGGSASASEIVAGAIQDRGRGTLIGEMTFGKGSVQLLHTLSDGSELRVTIARWFTPADLAIHGEGLTPDIEIPVTQEDQDAGLDPQLERAVEHLKTGR
jgi:carboxyl-terminal processing protease